MYSRDMAVTYQNCFTIIGINNTVIWINLKWIVRILDFSTYKKFVYMFMYFREDIYCWEDAACLDANKFYNILTVEKPTMPWQTGWQMRGPWPVQTSSLCWSATRRIWNRRGRSPSWRPADSPRKTVCVTFTTPTPSHTQTWFLSNKVISTGNLAYMKVLGTWMFSSS